MVNNTGNNNNNNNYNNNTVDDDDDDDDDDNNTAAVDYIAFISVNNGCVQIVGWNGKLLKILPYKLSTKLIIN